jgi:hypothetical protein
MLFGARSFDASFCLDISRFLSVAHSDNLKGKTKILRERKVNNIYEIVANLLAYQGESWRGIFLDVYIVFDDDRSCRIPECGWMI